MFSGRPEASYGAEPQREQSFRMSVVYFVFILVVLLSLLGFWLLALWQLLRKLADSWDGWTWPRRISCFGAVAAVFFAPYLVFKAWELPQLLDRVPEPLEAIWIEYRLEESWGFGPGGNETGFAIYRLTPASAQWARSKGARLNEHLAAKDGAWRQTPIDDFADRDLWHRYDDNSIASHPPDFREFLGRYGFSIPVAGDRIDQANRVIRNTGSFYSYGRGGSLTVIDPEGGKVYFAYAG